MHLNDPHITNKGHRNLQAKQQNQPLNLAGALLTPVPLEYEKTK